VSHWRRPSAADLTAMQRVNFVMKEGTLHKAP